MKNTEDAKDTSRAKRTSHKLLIAVLAGILGIEAAVCIAFSATQRSLPDALAAATAFPFEQIGMGLRSLSLVSGAGNALALAIYIALGLIPIVALFILKTKRKLRPEDTLLVLLSLVLLVVLYYMINPGLTYTLPVAMLGEVVGKALMGGIVYSILCGYLILCLARLLLHNKPNKLIGYMILMLGLLGAYCVYMVCGACLNSLVENMTTLRSGNYSSLRHLNISSVFLVLQFIVDVVPYILNVIIVFAALGFLSTLQAESYSEKTLTKATFLSKLCVTALAITVLVNIVFNTLQLVFAQSLMVFNGSVQVPLFSIALVLGTLLLVRFVTDSKQLKDDNEKFI
ncbi:MAG: hypothetical protein FWG00_01785 [Coriobacteriia bacterium]|nr:hypothetical protein [Coriobacteriia bacterium]